MAEGAELEGVPAIGDVVMDKYRVDRVLGVGGMGAVVAATHLTLNQPVAIKFLLADVALNPKNVERFTREAQAAARLRSDHVARVSDIGTTATGAPYMVMEYLDGEDLCDRIEKGRIDPSEAARFVIEACEALAEAHAAGIVHRDLKPANLYLARRADGSERVKLLDFGISKIVGGKGADLTRTSALMGSPLYMSPEQMRSAKGVDSRSDIWALGCILFESVSGEPPFIGDTLPQICSRILSEAPRSLRALAPGISAEFEGVVMACLVKDPEQRIQNVAQLASALVPFAGDRAAVSAAMIERIIAQAPAGAISGVRSSLPNPPSATVAAAPAALPAVPAQAAATAPPHTERVPPGVAVNTVHGAPPPAHIGAPNAAAHAPGLAPAGSAVPHPAAYAQATYPSAGNTGNGQAQWASTAAPVAQTYPGTQTKRGPWLAIAALVAVAGVAVAAVLAFAGGSSTTPDAQAGGEAPAAAAKAPEPSAAPEPRAEPTATASATASASAVVASRPTPIPPRPQVRPPHHPPQRPTATVPKPPPPPTDVRPGDDLFNTLDH